MRNAPKMEPFTLIKMIKNSIFKQPTALIFLVAILIANFGYAEETKYSPYPIIFIHGVNASMVKTWGYTKDRLERYFKDGNGYKYFQDNRQDYFPDCDYSFMNNGDIQSIAWTLKESIDKAIKDLPAEQQKVIIVAHSMGGLVIRSLLKQLPDYQSKIDKVIFIGTPHLGAPAASVLWIYNEIAEKDLPALFDEDVNFYSQTALSPFRFQQAMPATSNFDNRKMAILAEEEKIAKILAGPKIIGPYPDGIALEELRLAGDVLCSYYINSYGIEPIPIIKSVNGSDAFLGKASLFLANPSNFRVIRGVNTQRNISSWAIDKVIGKYEKDFIFPIGQSLSDAKNTGDGIVTQASQEGIGPADYTIDAFHTDEPNAWQTILLALEDAPEIESVRAVPVDWWRIGWKFDSQTNTQRFVNEQYVIIKGKDYFLADVEIDSIVIDGETVTLPDNFKGADGKYKPYNAFGKKFLESREDTSAPYRDMSGSMTNLVLQPGEFWVKLDLAGKNTISIKIKNPAAQFDADKFNAEKHLTLTQPTIKCPKARWDTNPFRFVIDPAGIWQIGFWQPVYWVPFAPPPNVPVNILDIPPFDQNKIYYDEDGGIHRLNDYFSERTTCSFEVSHSLFPVIRVSVFTYLNHEELIEDNIIKRVLIGREETLNSIGITEEGRLIYGKFFDSIVHWDGTDERGGYDYTSRIAWRTSIYSFPTASFGTIGSILVIESIDDDLTDNLLPLTFSYLNGSFYLEK